MNLFFKTIWQLKNNDYLYAINNNTMEEYKIITSNNPHYLSGEVNSHIKEGWKRVGSHQVVAVNMTVNMTNRMAGNTIHGANYEIEYSQTMVKEASNGTNV